MGFFPFWIVCSNSRSLLKSNFQNSNAFFKHVWCIRGLRCRYRFYKSHIQVDKSQLYYPSRTSFLSQASLSPSEIWPLWVYSFNSMISQSLRCIFQMNSVNTSLLLPTPFLSGVASDFPKIRWNPLFSGSVHWPLSVLWKTHVHQEREW